MELRYSNYLFVFAIMTLNTDTDRYSCGRVCSAILFCHFNHAFVSRSLCPSLSCKFFGVGSFRLLCPNLDNIYSENGLSKKAAVRGHFPGLVRAKDFNECK